MKWKIFDQSILLPRNRKILKTMICSNSKWKKISNRETGKYVYLHKVEINGIIFFTSLRI